MGSIDRGNEEVLVKSRTRVISIALVILMAIASVATVAILAPEDDKDDETPSRIVALTPHAPIYISGDAGFTNASGVVWGSGTEADPYIISGFDINASSNYGIFITGTTKNFVIRDCLIHDGVTPIGYHGIFLWSVQNATVTNNTLTKDWTGVVVVDSANISIAGNNCSDNKQGIYCSGDGVWGYNHSIQNNLCSYNENQGIALDTIYNTRIVNNTCVHNGYRSIDLDSCTHVLIEGNNCSYNDFSGILLGSTTTHCLVANNTCEYNQEYGIYLSWSHNNSVDNNGASHNYLMGIFLQASSNNNSITSNDCNDNDLGGSYHWGIGLESCNYNLICNNSALLNLYGIAMLDSDGNTIMNNTVDSNTNVGIVLSWIDNDGNMITGNHIEGNANFGVSLEWGHNNMVWNNTFIDNNGAGAVYDAAHLQGYDEDSGNHWNTSGTPHGWGNNWSDLQAPDGDWDGIVDWSYNMTWGVKDYYPLTTPGTPIPEPAVLILVGLMAGIFFISNHARKKKKL